MFKTYQRARRVDLYELRPGSVLVAKPNWNNQVLQRGVIMLVLASAEGASGMMLNRPANLTVREALTDFPCDNVLHYGGNTTQRTICYLHPFDFLSGGIYMRNGVYYGGDYDHLKELTDQGKIDFTKMVFCAGFVTWKPGELEKEMRDDRWWVMNDVGIDRITTTPSADMWNNFLLHDQHPYGLFDAFPDYSFN